MPQYTGTKPANDNFWDTHHSILIKNWLTSCKNMETDTGLILKQYSFSWVTVTNGVCASLPSFLASCSKNLRRARFWDWRDDSAVKRTYSFSWKTDVDSQHPDLEAYRLFPTLSPEDPRASAGILTQVAYSHTDNIKRKTFSKRRPRAVRTKRHKAETEMALVIAEKQQTLNPCCHFCYFFVNVFWSSTQSVSAL